MFGLAMAFFDWPIVGTRQFAGFANFSELWGDPLFWASLKNTLVFTAMTVPPNVILALILANIVNQKLPGMKLFRLALFIPFITSTAIVAIVWKSMYAPTGAVNQILSSLNLPTADWLSNPDLALGSVAVMTIWKQVGFSMLILVAGLQTIPDELREAARIDQASWFQTYFRIVLPLMAPVVLLVTILATIDSFQVFDATYVMTGGGPGYSTTTLVYYIYNSAFVNLRMGYAATIALALLVVILTVSLIQRRLLGGDKEVHS
ncbi:MAG: carbohydrate ABC transporter permease [Arachnia sp.]